MGLLAFYIWHHIMLLTLKDDNIIGSFWLCCLFYVFCVTIICGYICTRRHLYTITIYADGMICDKPLCLLLVPILCYVIGWLYFTYDMHPCGYYVNTDIFMSLFMSYNITTITLYRTFQRGKKIEAEKSIVRQGARQQTTIKWYKTKEASKLLK